MTELEFEQAIQHLLPESRAEITAVWIEFAGEIADYASEWLADSAEEIERGEPPFLTTWYRLRSVAGNNLQEIHASLYDINRRFGSDICRQIHEMASIPFCMHPLEALNVAEYLNYGGDPANVYQQYEKGWFEWDIPKDESLLTPNDPRFDRIMLRSQAISAPRKAELFDSLLESVHDRMPDGSWYDIFREIGMYESEMRGAGFEPPQAKVVEHALRKIVCYIEDEIKSIETEGRQPSPVVFSVDELAARFGADMSSYQYAEDILLQELYSCEGLYDVDLTCGKLLITPYPALVEKQEQEPEPPSLTML